MLSCTMLAASCEGQEITTVEGVSEHGALAAIQKAYGDWGGAQCGFCTPGFMMTVKHLLATNPNPTEEDVRAALSSNLCRCTGYSQMYEAIKAAIEAEQKGMAAATCGQGTIPLCMIGIILNYLATSYEALFGMDSTFPALRSWRSDP